MKTVTRISVPFGWKRMTLLAILEYPQDQDRSAYKFLEHDLFTVRACTRVTDINPIL